MRKTKRGFFSDDVTLGLFGVTIGLCCALFPWYVFFNQEQFGIRAMKFEGQVTATGGGLSSTPQTQREAAPAELAAHAPLDSMSTGTTPAHDESKPETEIPQRQPFPGPPITFKLVHVQNGRGMIEDASGLYVVQRGSVLPDMSHVASIEQRDGKWVIVTDADRVIPVTP